jgi:hypothetical protein
MMNPQMQQRMSNLQVGDLVELTYSEALDAEKLIAAKLGRRCWAALAGVEFCSPPRSLNRPTPSSDGGTKAAIV